MDDGLVLSVKLIIELLLLCLNPYCSGRWSRTMETIIALIWNQFVLILIVVDDGLVLSFIRSGYVTAWVS